MEYGVPAARPYAHARLGPAAAGPGPGGLAVGQTDPTGMDMSASYVPIMVGPDGQAYIHVSQLQALSSAVASTAATENHALPPSAPLAPLPRPPVPDTWSGPSQAGTRPFYTLESLESDPSFASTPASAGGYNREGGVEANRGYTGVGSGSHVPGYRTEGASTSGPGVPAYSARGLGAQGTGNEGPEMGSGGLAQAGPAWAQPQRQPGSSLLGVGPVDLRGATVYPKGTSRYDHREPLPSTSVHARLGARAAGPWAQPPGVSQQGFGLPAGRPLVPGRAPPAEKPPLVFQYCTVCQLRLPQTDMKAHRAGKRHAAMLEQTRQNKAGANSAGNGAVRQGAKVPQGAGTGSNATDGPNAGESKPGSQGKVAPSGPHAGTSSATSAMQAKAGTAQQGAVSAPERSGAGEAGKPSAGTAQAPLKPAFVPRLCPICPGVNLASEGAFRSHMAGRRHAENLAAQAVRAGAGRLGPGILTTSVGPALVGAAAGPMSFWQNLGGAQKRPRDFGSVQSLGAVGKRPMLGSGPLGPILGGPPPPAGIRRKASLGPPFIPGECDVCGASLTTELNFRHHFKGKRHLAAEEALAEGKTPQEARAAGLRRKDKRFKAREDEENTPGSRAWGQERSPGAKGGNQGKEAKQEDTADPGASAVAEGGAQEGGEDANNGVIPLVGSEDTSSAAVQGEGAGAEVPSLEGTEAADLAADATVVPLVASAEPDALDAQEGGATALVAEECGAHAEGGDHLASPPLPDAADAAPGVSEAPESEIPDHAEVARDEAAA